MASSAQNTIIRHAELATPVDGSGNCFKMGWIYASSGSASVIQLKTVRDRAFEMLER